jgi:hypothetical protein
MAGDAQATEAEITAKTIETYREDALQVANPGGDGQLTVAPLSASHRPHHGSSEPQ